MTKSALITGQDGSYLTELLLEKGYDFYGLVRHLSSPNISWVEHIFKKITLVEGYLADQSYLNTAVMEVKPHEAFEIKDNIYII